MPPTQLFGAEFRRAFRGQRNIEQRRKKRRRFLDVELYLGERRLEVGEPPFGVQRPGRQSEPAPLRDWMQRRILQKLGRVPFNPGVRRLTEPGVELLDEPGLSEPRLADDLDKLALAGADAVPATEQRPNVLLAADEGR